MRTSRGKKGTGGKQGESSGRRRKTKAQHRAKKSAECAKHKQEGRKSTGRRDESIRVLGKGQQSLKRWWNSRAQITAGPTINILP